MRQLEGFPSGFSQSIVIPFYRETTATLQRFCDFAERNSHCLLVAVINRPESNRDTQWAELLLAMPTISQGQVLWQSANKLLRLIGLDNQSGILLVDRCIKGAAIADKQGVGQARKIGADIACQLITQDCVTSPWIANTDADAILPDNYRDTLAEYTAADNYSAALVFPYQHIFVDDTPRLPTLLYEFSLHYYVAGLQWAGSPYAYQTLGSTIAMRYNHYAMVRGFPKRSGAEDFYLLSKLAKTGSIISLQQPVIKLQARESDRVPFGTGPAVTELAANENPLLMPLYHPDSFYYLKYFLELLAKLAEDQCDLTTACEKFSTIDGLDTELFVIIAEKLKLSAALTHCYQQGKSPVIRLQHLHHWFDGFKTLKFIHLLRGLQLQPVSYQDWLKGDYSFKGNNTMDSLSLRIADYPTF